MVKKFIGYFLITFIVVFSILNSRFVSAQVSFWFRQDELKKGTVSAEKEKLLPLTDDDFYLSIPTLDVSAPVVLEKSTDQNKIFDRLEEGVVHYGSSPLPGQKGASIILGHSSAYPWYKGKYGSVFALLGRLKTGDVIKIQNGDKILNYKVSQSLVFYPFSKDKRLEQLEKSDKSSIILVSCWPVGTNYRRIAIRADLI